MSSSAVGVAAAPSRAVGGDVDEVELARELPRDRLNDAQSRAGIVAAQFAPASLVLQDPPACRPKRTTT